MGGAMNVKWSTVAESLPGRLGKQVRERWQNHLDPALTKEPWDEEEDQLLISLQAVMGNRWSEIARAFAGRSENSVRRPFSELFPLVSRPRARAHPWLTTLSPSSFSSLPAFHIHVPSWFVVMGLRDPRPPHLAPYRRSRTGGTRNSGKVWRRSANFAPAVSSGCALTSLRMRRWGRPSAPHLPGLPPPGHASISRAPM